ncbi:MAG TPA: hypothetical protein VLK27_12280 [Chthoniobacterales bacterium]|nr:hypothetical protein [Chthoniobacterales bacterium]
MRDPSLVTNHWSLARREFLGAVAAGLVVVAFCFALLCHNPLVFWNDDYELSILPVFSDVARSWSEGHFPLLSPYSWVCSNLAGEFQYGTFSIFVNAVVVLVWKFPLTFPQQAAALSITHLAVLAAGAFLLARDRKLSFPLSVFVALIAAVNGWIICWGATDWFGALAAFTWLPWAWWGLERALDQQRSRWRFLWPSPFVYLLVTGGFPYTVLMSVLLIAGLAIKSWFETQSWRSSLPLLSGAALGFGLSAPAWLAIFDYVYGSERALQSAGGHWQWIVPWRALPAFIVPCWTVNWADFSTRYLPHPGTELACGLAAPAALVAGFIRGPSTLLRRLKWELLLLLFLLLLCMVPMAGLFRWSFRWLPFFHLTLALCAAEALQRRPRLAVGSTAFLLLIVVTIPMSIFSTGGTNGATLTWVYFQVAAIWALFELFLPIAKVREWAPPAATFSLLLATYICISPNCGVPKYNLSQDLLKSESLDPARLYFSVYQPPETNDRVEKKPQPIGQLVRPGSTSMWAGLHFLNGYSPILSAGVPREFDFRIHGEINLHEAEYLLWDLSNPDELLAQLGVDGIVVAWDSGVNPALGADWELVESTEEAAVYHRIGPPLQRVRSVAQIDFRPNESFATATISGIADTRNHVVAQVDVPAGGPPALLTFSRPYFRGYQAKIGNRALGVDSYHGLFPVVEVPAGAHGRLSLIYRPWWLLAGGTLSVFCAAIWLFGIFKATRMRAA